MRMMRGRHANSAAGGLRRKSWLRALAGATAALLLVPLLSYWTSNGAQATVTVLSEDWSSCTATTTNLWTPAGQAPYSTGGTAAIPVKNWDASPSVTCPNWTVSPGTQTFLAEVYNNLTSSATATGQKSIFLNEGNKSTTMGQISRTLTGLRPGGFYEIIVEAWRDASPGNTTLEVQVVSGAYTRNLTLGFISTTNGVQTIQGQFDVGASTATIRLTGGILSDASPIVKSVTVNTLPTVVFNANDGTSAFTSQTSGSAAALTANAFTRTGYTFSGWNTQANGGGTAYTDGQSYSFASDLELYAQWTALPKTVTFDANGGIGSMSNQTAATATALTANAFTRAGYSFAGWNTLSIGGGTAYADQASYPFTADATLYAQWTAPPPPPAPAPAPAAGATDPPAAPAPVPTRPTLDPIANPQNQSVPPGGLPAGSSLLLVNGAPTSVNVAPNAPSSPTGLVVTGDGFTMRLAGMNAQGKPLGLSFDGGALVLEQDRTAQVEGTGFLANSEVRLYVFSTPRYIGSVTTDATGNFSGTVPIPMDLAVGRHTLQANGYAKDSQVRSLSLGVVVKPDQAPRVRVAQTTVTFMPLSSQLTSQAKDQLRALLKGRKGSAVRSLVVGYVQPTSRTANDEALSTARAKTVKTYLRSLGLKGKVTAKGDGIANETGAAGRKVVVKVTYRK